MCDTHRMVAKAGIKRSKSRRQESSLSFTAGKGIYLIFLLDSESANQFLKPAGFNRSTRSSREARFALIGKREKKYFSPASILRYAGNHEDFVIPLQIQRGLHLLLFPIARADCSIRIASSYIRAIVFLCQPLTRHQTHRSIAFTAAILAHQRGGREASHEPSRFHRQAVD